MADVVRVRALVVALLVVATVAVAPVARAADVELFTREGCPRCAQAEAHLQALAAATPALVVSVHDVGRDAAARSRLAALAAAQGTPAGSVPALLVRGTLLVGWSEPDTPARLAALIAGTADGDGDEVAGETCGDDPGAPCAAGVVELPLVGRIDVRDLGLPLFTIALGLLDGFNPCAMWVLLFLLSLLVHLHEPAAHGARRRHLRRW